MEEKSVCVHSCVAILIDLYSKYAYISRWICKYWCENIAVYKTSSPSAEKLVMDFGITNHKELN
jgi:hypothetical protein